MVILNPFELYRHASGLRKVAANGGPTAVKLVKVGEPRGMIIQRSELVLEVETKDGPTVKLDPDIPMPFLVGWGIRLARTLHVPLISHVEPEDFSFRVPVPGR